MQLRTVEARLLEGAEGGGLVLEVHLDASRTKAESSRTPIAVIRPVFSPARCRSASIRPRGKPEQGRGHPPPEAEDRAAVEIAEQALAEDRQAARSGSSRAATAAGSGHHRRAGRRRPPPGARARASRPAPAPLLARRHLRKVGLQVVDLLAVAGGRSAATRRQPGCDLDHLGDVAALDRLLQEPVDQHVAGERKSSSRVPPSALPSSRSGHEDQYIACPAERGEGGVGEAAARPYRRRVVRGGADRGSRFGHQPNYLSRGVTVKREPHRPLALASGSPSPGAGARRADACAPATS